MIRQDTVNALVVHVLQKLMRERESRRGTETQWAFIPQMIVELHECLCRQSDETNDLNELMVTLATWWNRMDTYVKQFRSAEGATNVAWPLFYVATGSGKPCCRVVPEISDEELLIVTVTKDLAEITKADHQKDCAVEAIADYGELCALLAEHGFCNSVIVYLYALDVDGVGILEDLLRQYPVPMDHVRLGTILYPLRVYDIKKTVAVVAVGEAAAEAMRARNSKEGHEVIHFNETTLWE